MTWAGNVARVGEMRNAYNILVGKHEGKRPLETPRHRWSDNMRTDIREMWWEGMDWMHLTHDRDQ